MNIREYIESIDREGIFIHLPEYFNMDKELKNGALLISHELSTTGAPLQLNELSSTLRVLGYTPFVFSISEGPLLYELLDKGICVISKEFSALDVEWLRKLIKGIDFVFINTLILAPLVRFFAPIVPNLFWWIHESSFVFEKENSINIPYTQSLKILAASKRCQAHIERYMERSSTVLNVCIPDCGVAESIEKSKTVFLWVGILYWIKAPEVLLRAVLSLPKQYLIASEFFVVASSNSGDTYIKMVKELEKRLPNFHYLTEVSHNVLMQMINEIDAVVVTSIEETTSMVAAEAIMKGKTLICSDGCGISEYLEDGQNALIYPVNDSDALCEKIKYVIDHPEKAANISVAGRFVYEKLYTREIFEQNVERLLNDSVFINENMNKCCGCGACALSCPSRAIIMRPSIGGFPYPEVDHFKCIKCGKCKSICPVNHTQKDISDLFVKKVYAYRLKEEKKRMLSQSGGAFTAFAEEIIKEGGTVFGVSLMNNNSARYIEVKTEQELYKLKGSKYIQAMTDGVFQTVMERLEENKKVLFGGTSCHIEGLLSYLKDKDTSNLYTCDLICHGVPAPYVYKKYVKYQSRKYGEMRDFNFRNKRVGGWHRQVETWKTPNNEMKISREYTDLFYSDIALRECCYNCRYASFEKPADITIGDFWGVENVIPEMDDNTGVSLVIEGTEKGRALIDKTEDVAVKIEVKKESCLQHNLVKPTVRPETTDLFWNRYLEMPYKYLLRMFTGAGWNRLFSSEINKTFKNDEKVVNKISNYIKEHNIQIVGICGEYDQIRLFLTRMKDRLEKEPVVVNVFDHKKVVFDMEMISVVEYIKQNKEGSILVVDETGCESYMEELVEQGLDAGNILPISFILDEEV